jgi:hypothetical protein
MSPPDTATVTNLLAHGPHRSEVGRKQLTLAFGNLYIASTTNSAKPLLVWEAEKGYPRYYVPEESLHDEIKAQLSDSSNLVKRSGSKSTVELAKLESITGKGNDSEAYIERLTVGSRSTTWVRFIAGPLKGFVRFERNEIGE